MRIPQDIVTRWSDFVADWCLGIEPAEQPDEVERAFRTLHRLWPEYLSAVEASGSRGIETVAPVISLGLTLAACESLSGFESVLTRIRGGEKSSLVELEFAAALVRSELTPELEPPYGSKVLDCSVQIGSERVFAEVIAPETSDPIKEAETEIQRISDAVIEQSPGTNTEILLEGEPGYRFDSIIASATAVPLDGAVHYVEGVGWFRRVPSDPLRPEQMPRISYTGRDPVLGMLTAILEAGLRTSAMIHIPILDERAHRILSAELHHFSSEERNILVVCVSNVPGGMKLWLALARRWFQPTRNRRVGAIVLYDQALEGTPLAMRQRWRVVENPYAYVPVPDSLLNAIRRLDVSSAGSEDAEAGTVR